MTQDLGDQPDLLDLTEDADDDHFWTQTTHKESTKNNSILSLESPMAKRQRFNESSQVEPFSARYSQSQNQTQNSSQLRDDILTDPLDIFVEEDVDLSQSPHSNLTGEEGMAPLDNPKKVNVDFHTGPQPGSSPPTDSIYISTMPPAYHAMYDLIRDSTT